MQFTLSIKLHGAAFEGDGGYEIARMLRHIVEQLENLGADDVRTFSASIHDSLGQRVGAASVDRLSP